MSMESFLLAGSNAHQTINERYNKQLILHSEITRDKARIHEATISYYQDLENPGLFARSNALQDFNR